MLDPVDCAVKAKSQVNYQPSHHYFRFSLGIVYTRLITNPISSPKYNASKTHDVSKVRVSGIEA